MEDYATKCIFVKFVPIISTFTENRNTSEETYHGLAICRHTTEHSSSSNRIIVSKVLKDTNIILGVYSILPVTLVRTKCRRNYGFHIFCFCINCV